MIHIRLAPIVLSIFVVFFSSFPTVFPLNCGEKRIVIDENNVFSSITDNNCIYIITGRVNLYGKTIRIPSGCVIDLYKGYIINGSIIGSNTTLKGLHTNCIGFNAEGSWLISEIDDSCFNGAVLSDYQILSNVNRMQNDKIHNKIVLKKESYTCSINRNGGYVLDLTSNTDLELSTIISITGNNYTNYNIIRIFGKENISITGGILIGDVGHHKYVEGSSSQWGHGLLIYNARHVRVERLTVMKCIGDGFTITGGDGEYIGDMSQASQDITLNNVSSLFNRRQGLSIIHAESIIINNSLFTDTGSIEYQSPSAGIDIEPNTDAPNFQAVKDVVISNCVLERNVGYGILSNHYVGHHENKSVENVLFSGCSTDSRVVLYTGGIDFENTKMQQVSIISQKDPILGVSFSYCVISGGNGIQLTCPSSTLNTSTGVSGVSFDNCVISVQTDVDTSLSKGLISYHGIVSRISNVLLKNCRITIPPNAPSSFNLIGASVTNISFDNCRIDIPDRIFPSDRVYRSNCRIISRNINE